MTHTTDRPQTLWTIIVVVVSLSIFTTMMVIIKPAFVRDLNLFLTLMMLNLGLAASLIVAPMAAKGLLVQFTQRLYALSPEDAEELVNHILDGLPVYPPFEPSLRVDKGRVDPDGPEVLRKVGGPGFLSVGHDSIAVIARGGIIVDVKGPGFYRLEPFMKVWDVVDLRPQRRKIKVEANTRDGIPIYCEVKMRFRIDNGEASSETFTETAREHALKFTTTRAVLAPGSKNTYSDWANRIANGIVDGQVRDCIEKYRLDALLATSDQEPSPLSALESDIIAASKDVARSLGVYIEEIHLGPILPAEDAISQQWLETWRSEWERTAAQTEIAVAAKETEEIGLVHIHAQADLVISIIKDMKRLGLDKSEISPELAFVRFCDVIRTMVNDDPIVQSTAFLEAESLKRIILSPFSSQSTTSEQG